jgi:hypothetical protein
MTLRIAAIFALAALLACSAVAGDETGRAQLMGSWKLADGPADASVWTFEAKGDIIHITYSNYGHLVMDFECDSFGHDCATKNGGHPVKVSLWFAGDKLVEMETRGNAVWKRTFGVTGDGGTMNLEYAQLAPSNKAETQHFVRQPPASAPR